MRTQRTEPTGGAATDDNVKQEAESMAKQAKGRIKAIEGKKPGQGVVMATNMSGFQLALSSVFGVLAALRAILLAVQAVRGLVYRGDTRRRLMADVRRKGL